MSNNMLVTRHANLNVKKKVLSKIIKTILIPQAKSQVASCKSNLESYLFLTHLHIFLHL